MTTAGIIARLAERQAELERLGDIGTARAQDLININADVLALAQAVADTDRIDRAVQAELMGSYGLRLAALEAMFETAGNA